MMDHLQRFRVCLHLRRLHPQWRELEHLIFTKHLAANQCLNTSKYYQDVLALSYNLERFPSIDLDIHSLVTCNHKDLRGGENTRCELMKQNIAQIKKSLENSEIDFDTSKFQNAKRKCKKCGNTLMITFEQRRSADEGMTEVILPCENPQCK
jgi:DNA-directed RNA polymerase subunit M/transcription elongation factor TFIIS